MFKRYYLELAVEGKGLAQSLGKAPLESNGIDTSKGEVNSLFRSGAELAIDIDPRTGQVRRPWPKPGYYRDVLVGFGSAYVTEGAWKGSVGDTPDSIGTYSCNFSASIGDLRGLSVVWTFAGVPAAGKIPVAFGISQPQGDSPKNTKVGCSGSPSDHGYPGAGTIGDGVFMDHMTGKPHIARIPVKALLVNMARRGRPVIRLTDSDIVDGQCGGCPLPMTGGDVASFVWTLEAELRTRKI